MDRKRSQSWGHLRTGREIRAGDIDGPEEKSELGTSKDRKRSQSWGHRRTEREVRAGDIDGPREVRAGDRERNQS